MAHEPINMQTITGYNKAVIEKAEELVEVEAGEPRAGKQGTMFFLFRDYLCVSHDDGTRFWHCESIDGTALPSQLEGSFTHRAMLMDKIERYGDAEQQARGRAILEAKQKKLQEDIANGTKANTPSEDKRLKERVIRDARRRKQAIEAIRLEDAARDKPTFME